MKSITLINPEKAQEVFLNNNWIDPKYYIKGVGPFTEELLVNAATFKSNVLAVSLKVGLGAEYDISLEEYGTEISLELKDIADLGALFFINNEPYLLRVYKQTLENSLMQIGSRFPELRIVDFGSGKNEHIETLDCIVACKQLHALNLDNCSRLNDISKLPQFTGLKTLYLDAFKDASQFHFISECSGLEALSQNFSNLVSLEHLSGLNKLKFLGIQDHVMNVNDICALNGLTALTNLDLSHCENISDISPLSVLTALKNLDLHNCENLIDITPLSALTDLKNLDLSWCENLIDISPLSCITALTHLNLIRCENLSDVSPLSGLTTLTHLKLNYCKSISDISPISSLTAMTNLDLSSCENLCDISPISSLTAMTNLDLNSCENLCDISPLSGLTALTHLDLSYCNKLTKVNKISKLASLKKLDISDCPNIRDFDRLASLPQIRDLYWIDAVACNEILMSSAYNRKDVGFVKSRSAQWIKELPLSKDAILFTSRLLNCISLLEVSERNSLLQEVCKVIRARGLQSELLNDLDAYTWETWCNLVLELDAAQAMDCLHEASSDLDIKRETEVLLGPVIVAASEFIQKHPTGKEKTITWVNEQLLQLEIHPEEQRQIAPSAAVFFASLNKKEEVLFWLQKATNEKAPLWREKVLLALVNYYASQTDYAEARRLLDEMQMQEEKDKAIAALAKFMAATHPIDAGFLLDDIHEETISTEAARNMLQQPAMLLEPQGIYQLLLHLQSNPDELASTLETMISKDTDGQLAAAVKQLFLQPQTAGPSATVLLELCKHPVAGQFVKTWKLEELMKELDDASKIEQMNCAPQFIDLLESKKLIDPEEREVIRTKLTI